MASAEYAVEYIPFDTELPCLNCFCKKDIMMKKVSGCNKLEIFVLESNRLCKIEIKCRTPIPKRIESDDIDELIIKRDAIRYAQVFIYKPFRRSTTNAIRNNFSKFYRRIKN